jgi:hypothetical protein
LWCAQVISHEMPFAFASTAGPASQETGPQSFLSGAFFRLCAEHKGDGFDGLAPITGFRSRALGAKRAHGISGCSTVAEEAGAGLARNAHGLMPLHGIDVFGDHRIAPRILATQI